MDEELKENIKCQSTWARGLYMILFAIIYSIAEILVAFIAVFQFGTMLLTGKCNERLLKFGQSVSTFIYQMMRFFMFNSEEKPYPFSPWPEGETEQPEEAAPREEKKTARSGSKTGTTRKKAAKPKAALKEKEEKKEEQKEEEERKAGTEPTAGTEE